MCWLVDVWISLRLMSLWWFDLRDEILSWLLPLIFHRRSRSRYFDSMCERFPVNSRHWINISMQKQSVEWSWKSIIESMKLKYFFSIKIWRPQNLSCGKIKMHKHYYGRNNLFNFYNWCIMKFNGENEEIIHIFYSGFTITNWKSICSI